MVLLNIDLKEEHLYFDWTEMAGLHTTSLKEQPYWFIHYFLFELFFIYLFYNFLYNL